MHLASVLAVFSTLSLPFIQFVAAVPQTYGAESAPGARNLLSCVQKVLGSGSANRIITSSSDQYTSARSSVVTVDQFPALVVYANEVKELSPLVKCGVANDYKISPRSGSHHFENWSALSGSLVIDVANINYILPSNDLKTATVGGGARLGAIYSVLGKYGVTFTGGICPTVGIGGYVSVGGYNMQQRTYGLAIDHLKSAKIILANGDLVTVSAASNPDLWWAFRGGGTFGVIAELVIETTVLPRSAMFSMNFGSDTRLEVTQKFLNWASRQDPLFNSQLNLYNNRTNVLGWYLGKSVDELTTIVKTSGLLDVKNGSVKISGNCSPSNSRNFWLYTQDTCTDDATADGIFHSVFNVAPDALVPVPNVAPVTALSQVPALPEVPPAIDWARYPVQVKTFFEQKEKSLTSADIEWLVSESGKLSQEVDFWAEITTFNISSSPTESAFPWQSQAKTMYRLQVLKGSTIAENFMKSAESYLRPRFGEATYAGYIDTKISTNPFKAYYGNNVCQLVKARAKFDPGNVFSNPFSIPPKTPQGVKC